MRPITLADPEYSRAVLQQEINRHQDARYDHRLHSVSLVASGIPCERVALFFGDSPRSVVNWVRRFERQGLAGLAEGNHCGRPGRLSAEQLEEVRALIRKPPLEAGLEVNLWDGKTLAQCLQSRYEVRLGIRQCQRLFHQLDTRYRLPRPAVGKADPQRQAQHKKNSRSGRRTQP
jgi:transposase